MRAGRMDKRITLKNPTETRDAFGAVTTNWDLLDQSVWAEVKILPAKERFNSDRLISKKAATFFIWYLSGVNQKTRIVFDGDTYEVTGIRRLVEKAGLELSAEATF